MFLIAVSSPAGAAHTQILAVFATCCVAAGRLKVNEEALMPLARIWCLGSYVLVVLVLKALPLVERLSRCFSVVAAIEAEENDSAGRWCDLSGPGRGSPQQLCLDTVDRAGLDVKSQATEQPRKLLYPGMVVLHKAGIQGSRAGCSVVVNRLIAIVFALRGLSLQDSCHRPRGMETGRSALSGAAIGQHLGEESGENEDPGPRERSTNLVAGITARVSHLPPVDFDTE